MRVLDTTPIDSYTILNMGKRKPKVKRKEAAVVSSDEDGATLDMSTKCKHITRSVNLNSLKKGLSKQAAIGVCQSCEVKKDCGLVSASSVDDKQDKFTSDMGDELLGSAEPSVYMCLYCGFQGCDRSSEKKHALGHYDTQRSSPHCMAVSLSTWQVWCYICDDFIDVTAMGGKLDECVQYVRKQYNQSSATACSHPQTSQHWTDAATAERRRSQDLTHGLKSADSTDNAVGNNKIKQTCIVGADYKCAKVKGLTNLGNTCFFNAVMQNLNQTHVLEQQLRDYSVKSKQVTLTSFPTSDLQPSPVQSRRESHSDDMKLSDGEVDDIQESKEDDKCINKTRPSSSSERSEFTAETISVSLGDAGAMTRSLLEFFDEMGARDGNKQNIVRPSELFGHICQKAPRFKGFQQQDSHELLHYLLDGLKAEESKRVKTGILKAFNLPENVKPKDVPEKTRLKIKAYGPQTRHSFIDSVFGGFFINTVVCEDCHTHHQIFESFLDISLPISDDKTTQKSFTSKKEFESSQKGEPIVIQDAASKPSKNLTKKQMKSQRKKHKSKGKKGTEAVSVTVAPDVNQGEGSCEADRDENTELNGVNTECERIESTDNATKQSSSRENSESASDADVEDNFDEADLKSRNSTINPDERINSKRKSNGESEKVTNDSLSDFSLNGAFNSNMDSEIHGDVKQVHSENHISLDNFHLTEKLDEHLLNKTEASLSSKMEKLQLHEENNVSCNDNVLPDNASSSITAEIINEEVHSNDVENGENSSGDRVQNKINFPSKHLENEEISSENKNRNFSGDANSPSTDTDSGVTSLSNSSGNFPASNETISENGVSKLSAQLKNTLKIDRTSKDTEKEEELLARTASTQNLVPCIIPPAAERSVSVSLHRFTAKELLYGENKFMCSTCNEGRDKNSGVIRSNASKQMLIYCPPAVLTLHLKRFQQVGYTLRKDSRHISFPEILDIAPYCSALVQNVPVGQKEILYSLYGIVEHEGTMRGGHYTAYVKVRQPRDNTTKFLQTLCGGNMTLERQVETLRAVKQNSEGGGETSPSSCEKGVLSAPGKWYNISDTHVREVSCESVFKCEAYLLFYERVM